MGDEARELPSARPRVVARLTSIARFVPVGRRPLDRPRQVRLAALDVGGRQIQTLVHEFLPAGAHESLWNGRDQAGRTVPSGTYYFRLQTSAGVFLRKGLLLK